ncbi:MAG: MobH family relaxase, partial [Gammaproteobacteria bacterium]
ATQDLWTYATATAALLHDLGKPVADQRVLLFDRRGRTLGSWDPWAGSISADARWYRVEFLCRRSYRWHEQISPLLARFVLPDQALSWLGSDPPVLEAWLATVSGDDEHAGILGELVSQADRLSVAGNLAGTQSQVHTATRKPLAARLLTGLRYLLDQELLPLNRRGAAGWLVAEDLWLVSKRGLDSVREHLTEEGQTGIPTANDRLMDELQQYGLLVANGDRAVWVAEVKLGDWCQQLTLLRFPVRTVWPAADTRPATFEGRVTPVLERSSPCDARDRMDDSTTEASSVARPLDRDVALHVSEIGTAGPASSRLEDAPTLSTRDEEANGCETDGVSTASIVDPVREHRGAKAADRLDTQSTPENHGIDPGDAGHRFFRWLKDGLTAGHLPVNTVNARIHTVDEGVLLVSPGIFKDFNPTEWHSVQKRFQKLKLHRKTPEDTNVWTYAVNGKRKQSLIKGFVIPNPGESLGLQALPPPNPHLARPEETP